MFIDKLEVHNNTMVKNHNILDTHTHTHYIYYCQVKCINVQIYAKK